MRGLCGGERVGRVGAAGHWVRRMMCLRMRVSLGFWGLRRFEDEVLGVSDSLLGGGGYGFSSLGPLHGMDGYATTLCGGRGRLRHDYDIVLRGALKNGRSGYQNTAPPMIKTRSSSRLTHWMILFAA